MAKSEPQIDELRKRLGRLLADWETEISAVLRALENRQSSAAIEKVEALENHLAELRQRIRDRDLALDHLKKKSKEKDARLAELEAMRAELAARKSLVKSLRTDAERGKTLQKELAENREVIATMKESIDRHARTITELRRSSDSWERKYRRLVEAEQEEPSGDDGVPADGDLLTDTAAELFASETADIDGAHTIVIDMTEPLREARDEHRRKHEKG